MSLARVFCSWSIAAVLLLLSIHFSHSEKSLATPGSPDDENGEEGNGTSNVTLTGNPQIDYIHDPNLPRELNGYNLSDYPFYHRVPPNINFSCDGRKDGFYASVEHKCQIYHHCLFGSRYDFICANYTAFDQRTFICQFVSDVDCPNSHMYFHRNKDLYVTKSTTTLAPEYDRSLYDRRRPPPKKPKSRLRPDADAQAPEQSTAAPTASGGEESAAPAPPKKGAKDADYADDYADDYGDDYAYQVRRPARPRPRPRFRNKCRNGRRRGRRCRVRRPLPYYYDDEDYAYDDDYDYAYYDDVRPRKQGKKKRPLNAISAGTSQVTSTSSSETPPPSTTSQQTSTTTAKSTTQPPPSYSSTSSEGSSGPLDSESIAMLQKQRDELLTKTRRPLPNLRPLALRPSRQDKTRSGTASSSTTTTTSTTTERAKPSSTTTTTTTTTTEPPQYIYDYEYYEDDTAPMDGSSTTTTTTTTVKPLFRGKLRGANSAAALLEKQRVQQSIQVRVTEDQGTNTNTIRRRDNSNVQTPTRNIPVAVATPSPPVSSSSTQNTKISSTTGPPVVANRPARFWQRKSSVKSISTTTAPSTTTTTLAPFYQEYQDYEDMVDPQPSAPSIPPQQSSKFQPLLNPQPQQQYGTSSTSHRQSYGSTTGPSVQQYATSPRGQAASLSSSSYAPPPLRSNKHYSNSNAMQQQQYPQSSSSTSINSNSNSNNYNTNSYHRQRNPPPSVVPKPEFISLVDEDYNNPYVTGGSGVVGPTSPSSTRYQGGGSGGGGSAAGVGYHQHPIRYFEHQHQSPAFLFGAASEYNAPQFAFPPRSGYPSPSNFQPYGQSTRRFSAHNIFKKFF